MTRAEIVQATLLALTKQNVTKGDGGGGKENLSDFRNWVLLKDEGGTFSISYNAARNTSTLDIYCGLLHEKYIAVVPTKRNTRYTFRFQLASPTGFTCGGYSYDSRPFYHELAWVTAALPNLNAFRTVYYQPLGMTAWFDEVMSGDGRKYPYSCTFQSGDLDCVFLVFDIGYITDFTNVVLEVSDVELVEG